MERKSLFFVLSVTPSSTERNYFTEPAEQYPGYGPVVVNIMIQKKKEFLELDKDLICLLIQFHKKNWLKIFFNKAQMNY